MKTEKIKIYVLKDPRNGKIRYVGKTVQSLKSRLYHHLKAKNKSHKNSWIKSLTNNNLEPIIQLVDEIDYCEDWKWLECYWIAQFKSWGFNLTNMTDGGDGNNNQVFSKEAILKRANAIRGKKRPKEVRDKISKSKMGNKLPESVKKKISKTLTGKKQSEKTKRKRYKPVVQLDLEHNIIREFDYLRKAAKAVNGNPGPISNVCKGKQKTAYGYKWQYKEDIV